MPVPGRRPKPRDQVRNHHPLWHEFIEVPDVPFEGAPGLPRTPGRRAAPTVPEPPRPLGAPGLAVWDRAWRESWVPPDADWLLVLCEQMDERVGLRVRVLTEGDWHEREALRKLDGQVAAGLKQLGLNDVNSHPAAWPVPTRRWWKALGRMPHCALWTDQDWQFAHDTAVLVAAFHNGDLRLAGEIRTRERLMGTSPDARRALRIRYVDPNSGDEQPDEDTASVTAMDDYRRMAGQ